MSKELARWARVGEWPLATSGLGPVECASQITEQPEAKHLASRSFQIPHSGLRRVKNWCTDEEDAAAAAAVDAVRGQLCERNQREVVRNPN